MHSRILDSNSYFNTGYMRNEGLKSLKVNFGNEYPRLENF